MNRLRAEASPYLRQHVDNPVDWYPWGPEAFRAARDTDRPILLSVGYSACHWCHVMAHESFENEETAAVMNRLFVNIKVDREERPDVDGIYMEATQAMTGRGGWPMTVFMNADGEPFNCGTYYPPTARGGMPSFVELCEAIDDAWRDRRAELTEQATRLTDHVRRPPVLTAAPVADHLDLIDRAAASLVAGHDPVSGGFGAAPKFPHSMAIDLLLRHSLRTGSETSRRAATRSLDAMAAGGIYDHLGGGFARYSVDDRWLVPHFEKMLYDNALLIRPYLHGWQLTGSPRYQAVVEQTIGYLMGPLHRAGGGFYSAQDADSLDRHGNSVEGAYYVWSLDEVVSRLGDTSPTFIEWYGLSEQGNFEGANILVRPLAALDPAPGSGPTDEPPSLGPDRATMLNARSERPAPGLDDKVLTEWNALLIASLAEAAAVFARPDWLECAESTGDFLWGQLRSPSGRWMRSWQESSGARHLAYAPDYAALVDAFLRLYEATGRLRWLDRASTTAADLIGLFWDDDEDQSGGFFTTGIDAEELLIRPRDLTDNATPSADSTAAAAFARLAAVLPAEHPLLDRLGTVKDALIRRGGATAATNPLAFANLLMAMDLEVSGITEVVVPGDRPALRDVVREEWRPAVVLAWGEIGSGSLWEGRDIGLAYVCRDHACLHPAATPEDLRFQLR